MSKFVKLFAGLALAVGLMAAMPGAAQAQHHHGHGGWHGHSGWHHGWYGYRGWGPGFGFGLGYSLGYPYRAYYYPGPYYYDEPSCGWAPVRLWRYNHWVYRRVWRCW